MQFTKLFLNSPPGYKIFKRKELSTLSKTRKRKCREEYRNESSDGKRAMKLAAAMASAVLSQRRACFFMSFRSGNLSRYHADILCFFASRVNLTDKKKRTITVK